MKKKTVFCLLIFMAMVTFTVIYANHRKISTVSFMSSIDALSDGEGGNYSCTIETLCFNWGGTVVGSVSCTGSTCKRGPGFVECDGKRTEC